MVKLIKWIIFGILAIGFVVSQASRINAAPPPFGSYYACLAVLQKTVDEKHGVLGKWTKRVSDMYDAAEKRYTKGQREEGDKIFEVGLETWKYLTPEVKLEFQTKCKIVFDRAK